MIRLTHDGAVGVVTLSHPPHNLIGAEFIDRYCSAQEDAVAAGARAGPARAREITMLGRRYRPGTMATFGLDHPSVSAVNPRVVYVSMSATMLSVNERLHAEANDLDTLGEPTALSAPESPIFELADGSLITIAASPVWSPAFGRYCTMMGRNDLKADPRYKTPELRREHYDELMAELGATHEEIADLAQRGILRSTE